jgi:4-carboxymuconolactone decarboxylase
MRRKLLRAGALIALGAIAGAAAVAVAAPNFVLRGGRFQPLRYEQLDPAQKKFADAEIATGRKSFDGPTNIYLRSVEMAEAMRPLGNYLRRKAPMPDKLKEIAILLTARFWGGQYVWYSHRQFAMEAGLSTAFIEAMAGGRRPDTMTADEAAIFDFCSELLATRQVSDPIYKTFVDRFGERGVVETIGLMGHYHTTTMMFAVDLYPLPDGAKQDIAAPQ